MVAAQTNNVGTKLYVWLCPRFQVWCLNHQKSCNEPQQQQAKGHLPDSSSTNAGNSVVEFYTTIQTLYNHYINTNMPPIRSMPAAKPVKTERSHEENQERYVDAYLR